jgi:anti-sigma regulatory factor (Ser/Thr protein kinase)
MIANVVPYEGKAGKAPRTEELHERPVAAFKESCRCSSVAQMNEAPETAEFAFVLPNEDAHIPPVVEFLSSVATRMAVCEAMDQMRIGLALEEALVNALYHGNLEIDTDSEDNEQMWRHNVAQGRRCQQPFCDRRIRVLARINPSAAVFVVSDEGHGFDPSQLPDPTDDANLGHSSGRGVFLMRSLMDDVIFNEVGNEVTLIRRWNA